MFAELIGPVSWLFNPVPLECHLENETRLSPRPQLLRSHILPEELITWFQFSDLLSGLKATARLPCIWVGYWPIMPGWCSRKQSSHSFCWHSLISFLFTLQKGDMPKEAWVISTLWVDRHPLSWPSLWRGPQLLKIHFGNLNNSFLSLLSSCPEPLASTQATG